MVAYVSNQAFMKLNLKKSFKAFRFLIKTFNFIVCWGKTIVENISFIGLMLNTLGKVQI